MSRDIARTATVRKVVRWTVATTVVCAVMASNAVGADNVAATHAYIQASYALGKVGVASIPKVQAEVKALNSDLAHRCPRVGNGSGQTEATQPMAHEVASALWAIAYGYNARAIATFVARVGHLRWSDGRIGRIVARQASGYHELATLPRRDLCGDVAAWRASGFTAIPDGVVQLDERAEDANVDPVPARLLAPYERGSDARVLAQVKVFETKVGEAEFTLGQADWFEVLATLGLNQ